MNIQNNKLLIALGLSAVITYIFTRFFNVSCSVAKNTASAQPQTFTDSNKNTFEGTFQPAVINFEGTFQPAVININIDSNKK